MKPRTVLAVAVVLGVLGVAAGAGLSTGGATLEERWVSDTPRDNRVNHHPVGVGAGGIVVAPVSAIGAADDLGPTSCALVRLAPATGAVEWRAGVPPANCTSHALTGPTIADVDGDGDQEVVHASTERALHVREAATGEEVWRVPLETFGYGPPSVADVAGGPTPEIVVADIGGSVALVANRTVEWRRHLESGTWSPPILRDVNRDGRPEIVIGTNDAVVVLSRAGERVWTADVDAVSAAFVPGNGGPPLVLAGKSGAVHAVDGRTGDVAWTHEGAWTATVGAVGDRRVYAGLSGGRVLALDARSGERRWSTAVIPPGERLPTPEPVLGDVDGDGAEELVAVVGSGEVAVLDPATGSELGGYERDVPILTRATVADVNDDGAAEIFVRYGDGRVVSLSFR